MVALSRLIRVRPHDAVFEEPCYRGVELLNVDKWQRLTGISGGLGNSRNSLSRKSTGIVAQARRDSMGRLRYAA